MPHYRATGNLVIRPCATCFALVLHEEGEESSGTGTDEGVTDRWRPFPHNAPGGAACIGGGSSRLPPPRAARRTARVLRAVPDGEGIDRA